MSTRSPMPKAATPPEPRSIDRSFLNAEPKGDTQTPVTQTRVTQTRVEVFATACHYVADTLSPATHDLGHPAEKEQKQKQKTTTVVLPATIFFGKFRRPSTRLFLTLLPRLRGDLFQQFTRSQCDFNCVCVLCENNPFQIGLKGSQKKAIFGGSETVGKPYPCAAALYFSRFSCAESSAVK